MVSEIFYKRDESESRAKRCFQCNPLSFTDAASILLREAWTSRMWKPLPLLIPTFALLAKFTAAFSCRGEVPDPTTQPGSEERPELKTNPLCSLGEVSMKLRYSSSIQDSPHHWVTLQQTSRLGRAQEIRLASQHLFLTSIIGSKIYCFFTPLSYHKFKNNRFYLPRCRGQRFFVYMSIWRAFRANTKSNLLPVFQLQKRSPNKNEIHQGLASDERNYSSPHCVSKTRGTAHLLGTEMTGQSKSDLHHARCVEMRDCALLYFRRSEMLLGILQWLQHKSYLLTYW